MSPSLSQALVRYRRPALVAAALLLATLGIVALHRVTAEVRLSEVRAAFHAIAPWRIAAAFALTAASYLALTFYDVVALRIIDRPLRWRTAARASFVSYTMSHNLGLALLTGGSARYRVYTQAGLDGADVARIVASASVAFWAGVLGLSGMALMLRGQPVVLLGHALPVALSRGGGALLLLAVLGLSVAGRWRPAVAPFGWRLPLPRPAQGLALLVVAGIDLAAASAALFVLVPGLGMEAWPPLFLAYTLAMLVALVSNVPGGIGVFEAVLIAALPGDRATLLAALVAYRVIYYLIPFALAACSMAAVEGWRLRHAIGDRVAGVRDTVGNIAPPVMAALAFAGGAVLLISGALPSLPGRMRDLHDFLPLPFIEASYLAASVSGTLLLVLAPGLLRRLDAAFLATRGLLLTGALFSLAKGLDYEEAIICLVILALLQWTRRAFYRTTALTAEPLSPRWIGATALVVLGSFWIGMVAFRHVPYADALWLEFTARADAPRFLRGSLAVGLVMLGVVSWRLMRPAAPGHEVDVLPPAVLSAALARHDSTDALLATTGDKRFIVAPEGDAFLMYQRRGSTWVVMGDPVGPPERWAELLWTIRTEADRAQGQLILYQITPAALPLAIELGLQLIKYGEAATVDLGGFTLDGPRAKGLRHAVRRAEKEGATFDVVPAAGVAAILPELARISEGWLGDKAGAEKGFSVGRFDPDYLVRFDCAVVRAGGRIVAFANLWAMPDRSELSVDLMRHDKDMPYGSMDYLFVRAMEWGRDAGYRRFALGLAPMSGIEARHLSPIWAKIANFIFRHGNALYGFEGLRTYKEKFAPLWTPRYIAGPSGLALIRSLADLRALIGT
jgi:phosphatidylglycerol lysyltransferase